MPNKDKKSKNKAVEEVLFKETYSPSKKASEILTNSQSVLNEATVDFFTYFSGKQVKEPNSRDLYDLSDYGSRICLDCQKEVAQNPELLDRFLRLAALCFPYSPSPVENYIYFSLKENYRANKQNQTSYLKNYFDFLNYLLSEESVSANFRLTCLCGAMKFYENNSSYLTYSFIIGFLSLLDSPEVKKFFLLYKDKAVSESEFSDAYSPNYSILFTQSNEFLLRIGIEKTGIAYWRETAQRLLDEKTNLDKLFMRECNLSPIDLFELELKKIINQFPDFISKCKPEQQKIFIEKISIFNGQHPLALFFSETDFRQKISSIIDKVKGLEEKNREGLLAAEQARARRKEKKQRQKETKKEKKKLEKACLAAEKEKEEALKTKQAKIEQEFLGLNEYINKLSASLTRSTDYVKEIVKASKEDETKTVNTANKVGFKNIKGLEEQFKCEYGKLCSEIEAAYSLLKLEKPSFYTHIFHFLNEIKATISKQEKFTEVQLGSISKKIDEIEEIQTQIERDKNDVINKLRQLTSLVDKLERETIAIYKILAGSQKPSSAEIRRFNACKKEIEKLAREFELLLVAYKQYIFILPIDKGLSETDEVETKITSLDKIFFELNKDIEANEKAKQAAEKKKKQNEQASRSAQVALTKYQEYVDWEKDFRERFFRTLEVIHRLPYITFAQGGKDLIAIFLRKLEDYEKEVFEKKEELLSWKTSLTRKTKHHFHFVLREAENEFIYCEQLIADLKHLLEMYGLETKEFSHRELLWKANFNQQFRYFEAFFPKFTKGEANCIDLRLARANADTGNEELKKEYLEKKEFLKELRRKLNEHNQLFQAFFKKQPLLPQIQSEPPASQPQVPVAFVPVIPILVSSPTFFSLPTLTANLVTQVSSPQTSSEVNTQEQETTQKTLPKKR
jgi:hypothetical protein